MARAFIVGWAHTPFGELEDPDVESLTARVSGEALKHAGVGPEALNGIYVGVMNNGLLKQGFEGAQVALNQSALAYLQATHIENACATGPRSSTRQWTSSRAAEDVWRSSSARKKMTATTLAETSHVQPGNAEGSNSAAQKTLG